jgi:hypothetical protein
LHNYVQTVITNFSHEEIELPKATVLGVADVTSEELIASINDDDAFDKSLSDKLSRFTTNSRVDRDFQAHLTDRLAHLSREERSVIEPVLIRYRRVFQTDGSLDFPGIDVVEHRIETGDAKPIRRPPYKVPYALRKEMVTQVTDMLDKGIIEPSSSPWSAPAIFVPKRSLDGRPKYRFCVDFRALYKVTQFDAYQLPVFEETISTFHGSK